MSTLPSHSTPVSSTTPAKSSRFAIAATVALCTSIFTFFFRCCLKKTYHHHYSSAVGAVLLVSFIIIFIIRQYRRRMSRLDERRDAAVVDLEAAETCSDYTSFDDEKKHISATPSVISIPDYVYAPGSGTAPLPMTHEQRMKEVDVFFGGAPL